MKADAPLQVQMPARDADQPSWVRVGVIAAVGFVIGVGWPRLVGAKLGPSLPTDTSTATAARAESTVPVTQATPSPTGLASATTVVTSVSPSASASTAPAPASMPTLNVNHGVLLSCKGDDGQTMKGVAACGGLAGFDAIAQPRLRKLSTCPAANGSTNGKLSVLFNLDFASHRVGADVGKSSTVADPQGFATCIKTAFQGVSIGALDHQNPRYTIAYSVTFAPTEQPAASPASPPSSGPSDGVPAAAVAPAPLPASQSARAGVDDTSSEVAWEVAIVRDSPRTGAVVARLPRGTKVKLGTNQDGWYKVTYGSASEGWVYRGAIGR